MAGRCRTRGGRQPQPTPQPAPQPAFDPFRYDSDSHYQRWCDVFQKRKVEAGKYIEVSDFHSFQVQQSFQALGWERILYPPTDFFPELVQQFYSNLVVHNIEDDEQFHISSYVKGRPIMLTVESLGEILGVSSEGPKVYSPPRVGLEDFFQENLVGLLQFLLINPEQKKPTEKHLKPRARLYSRIAQYNITPRGGHRQQLQPLQLYVVYCLLTRELICLPYILLRNMATISFGAPGNLPYGRFLSRIFTHFDINVRGEPIDGWRVTPLNLTSLTKMKLDRYNGSEDEEEVPPAGSEDEEEIPPAQSPPPQTPEPYMAPPPVPVEPFVGSSSQGPAATDYGSLMSQMEAINRHIGLGFSAMDSRMSEINTHMDQRMSEMNAHMSQFNMRMTGLSDQMADIVTRQTRIDDQFRHMSLRFAPQAPPPADSSDED